MVSVPLGLGAYKRNAAGMPEIRLENRFLEANPTNLREKIALLSRCGTDQLAYFSGGQNRGNYFKAGLFNGALFVVSGENLYRYDTDGTKTQISGVINGTGHPYIGWMKGIGYEYLFIADGLLLQFYPGGSHATGTLTFTPGTITNQIIEVGGTYYSWNADVDTNAPAGTSAHPWLAKLGANAAESLANMAKLINFDGVRGTDFSTTLGGPSDKVSASSTATTLVVTAFSEYAAGNAITTTVFSGSALAWGGGTLTGGGTHALSGVPVPDGVGIKALASVSGYVLASVASSQKFFWINPGETTIDALNFAEKESNPDNIVDMLTVGDQVLIMGEGSTENWYASGDIDAPFVPTKGRVYARGVVDGTPVVLDEGVILVGNDGVVYEVGYASDGAVRRISTTGIEERIRTQLRREQGLV